LDRMGTEKDVTVMPPSHTNDSDVITFETPSDDIDDNSHTYGSAEEPAFTEEKLASMSSVTSLSSDKTNQSKTLLSLGDSTVITDLASFVGSGFDVDIDDDNDPYWPKNVTAA